MRRTILVTVAATVIVGLVTAGGVAIAQQWQPTIPDRVMLQAADFSSAVEFGPVEEGLEWPLLPQPCADTPVPQPIVSRSQAADVGTRLRVYENVARYRGDGARAYVNELKAQLDRCGVDGGSNGFDPQVVDHIGPDSLMFFGNYDEGDHFVVYVVAAVGRYVVVTMGSDPVRDFPDVTVANGIGTSAVQKAAAA